MKNVPNFITCLNLFAGCLSCVMSLAFNNFTGALIFILLAALFDFLDGFVARLLKAYSPIGAQLDSLADTVSFGLAPGFLIFAFLSKLTVSFSFGAYIPFAAFLIPVFAALRLAKFNVDKRQTSSFLGLPVPANGLFWGALIPSLELTEINYVFSTIFIIALIVVFCALMVSEFPMFSLKFTHYKWKGNQYPITMIFLTLILIAFFRLSGIYLAVVCYILLSLIKESVAIAKKTQ